MMHWGTHQQRCCRGGMLMPMLGLNGVVLHCTLSTQCTLFTGVAHCAHCVHCAGNSNWDCDGGPHWMRNHLHSPVQSDVLLHQTNVFQQASAVQQLCTCKVNFAQWQHGVNCWSNVGAECGVSECGIKQHSRQIIHWWIIPTAKHYSERL